MRSYQLFQEKSSGGPLVEIGLSPDGLRSSHARALSNARPNTLFLSTLLVRARLR